MSMRVDKQLDYIPLSLFLSLCGVSLFFYRYNKFFNKIIINVLYFRLIFRLIICVRFSISKFYINFITHIYVYRNLKIC